MRALQLILAAQFAFFLGWAGYLMSSKGADSPEFYLETAPVDPRDLISGTYVALNYGISSPDSGSCSVQSELGQIFVRLAPSGRTVNIASGAVPVFSVAECSKKPPLAPDWVSGSVQYSRGRQQIVYGIEKFFVNENDPRKDAASGSVIAKVKVGNGRKLVLLDLVNKF